MNANATRLFRQSGRFNRRHIFDFTEVSPKVTQHLGKVYFNLLTGILAAAAGCLVYMQFLLGMSPYQPLFATLGFLLWFAATPYDPYNNGNRSLRLFLYHAICFFKGCSIGPLVTVATFVEPGLVPTALFATLLIFGSFTMAALFSPSRSMLYLYGVLGSAVSALVFLSIANIFFLHSPALQMGQVYVGLVVFSLYVVADTQMIIAKAMVETKPDDVSHALELFIDFVAIFVRILIILMKQKKDKKSSKSSSR